MATLESIVLPLAESRKLVEAGMKLDTVVSWIKDGATHIRPVIVEPAVYEAVKSRIICPAPTLSELLDAITMRYPACALELLWSDDEWEIDLDNDLPQVCKGLNGKNHLLALANLLLEVMEVSK